MLHLQGCDNIVQLLDRMEDPLNVYLVMELCDEGDLWNTIDKHKVRISINKYDRFKISPNKKKNLTRNFHL